MSIATPSGGSIAPQGTTTVPPARRRVRIARIAAAAADLIQWVFLPAFVGGALSPVNNALDVAVGLMMTWLVGWHFAFLPTFVAELIPAVDLFPTWTAAVWFATRRRGPAQPGG